MPRVCVNRIRIWPLRRDYHSGVLIGAGGRRRSDWSARVLDNDVSTRIDRLHACMHRWQLHCHRLKRPSWRSTAKGLMNKFPDAISSRDGQLTIYADNSASAGTKDGGAGEIRRSPRRLRKKQLPSLRIGKKRFSDLFDCTDFSLRCLLALGSSNGSISQASSPCLG